MILLIWSYPNKTRIFERNFLHIPYTVRNTSHLSIHPSKPMESIFIIIKFLALPNEFSLFSIKTISMNMINCLVFHIQWTFDYMVNEDAGQEKGVRKPVSHPANHPNHVQHIVFLSLDILLFLTAFILTLLAGKHTLWLRSRRFLLALKKFILHEVYRILMLDFLKLQHKRLGCI